MDNDQFNQYLERMAERGKVFSVYKDEILEIYQKNQEGREANLFFTFVSDLYERVSIVVTSNKNLNSWSELMGDEVMTAALLDRLMHHAKIFSLSGESYRISAKKEE